MKRLIFTASSILLALFSAVVVNAGAGADLLKESRVQGGVPPKNLILMRS